VTITFSRTGGFAAVAALRVRAVVTIEHRRGGVESDDYYREIDAAEAEALASDAVAAITERRVRTHDATGARDAFRYEFSILPDAGNPETISACDDEPADSATGRLVVWARNEAARILARR
jgi:hypothetical protein